MSKKDKENKSDNKGKGIVYKIRVFVLPVLIAILLLPSTIVLGTLMLPSFVAVLLDRMRPKMLAITVGALNLAGASAGWFDLLRTGHTIENAKNVALAPENVFTAYGAALLGWILYTNVTLLVAKAVARGATIQIKRIDKRQDELKNIWGPSVAGRPSEQKSTPSEA